VTSIITLCIVVITFVAISVIITKAGFSRAGPSFHSRHCSLGSSLCRSEDPTALLRDRLGVGALLSHTIGLLLDVDKIAIFASWIFLLLFAFSHWPTRSVAAPSEQAATKTRVRVQCEVVQALLRARCNVNLRVTRCPKVQDSEHWASLRVPAQQRTKWSRTSPPNQGNQLATFCARCGDSVPATAR